MPDRRESASDKRRLAKELDDWSLEHPVAGPGTNDSETGPGESPPIAPERGGEQPPEDGKDSAKP